MYLLVYYLYVYFLFNLIPLYWLNIVGASGLLRNDISWIQTLLDPNRAPRLNVLAQGLTIRPQLWPAACV